MIQTFLFDIGGVLLKFDFRKALRALAAQSAIHDEDEVLHAVEGIKARYEDGEIPRSVFLDNVKEILRYQGTHDELVCAWEDIFEENTPMIQLVERLKGIKPLYLLSNTSDIHHEFVFARYPVFQHFTGGTYSYHVRASKPHKEIYVKACAAGGFTPETTFFIDDLPANIQTARELGFHSHQYDYRNHDALLKALEAVGIVVG